MYLFLDGVLSATTVGAAASAVYNHIRLKKTKTVLNTETRTLEAWTKHLDEEAKTDYTRLVGRLKDLT